MRNGSYVTLRDYMDIVRRVRKKAEEMRRIDHIFGAYLEKCTWEYMQYLMYPVSLKSLERRSLGCPMTMCCKEVYVYVSINVRIRSQCFSLLLLI